MPVEDPHRLVTGLMTTHGEQLRRFLRARAGRAADVPDLVQEVYLRMLRVPNVESVRSPEAYLFTVAQHVVQQHTLRQSAIPPSAELDRILHATRTAADADPALQLVADECLEQLQEALERLTPHARATFLLHRRDGLSFEQIAVKLNSSVPMVKKHLMQALIQLRQRIDIDPKERLRGP